MTWPELENVLRHAVDPVIGAVKQVSEGTPAPGEPDIFMMVAEYQSPALLTRRPDAEYQKLYGIGAALTREGAAWAALGEALERYSGWILDEDEIVYASYSDIADKAVDPSRFILYSEEQYSNPKFPHTRFDPGVERGWLPGFDLTDRRDILVPAVLVSFGYDERSRAESLDYLSSTGLSAGRDYASAAAGALREVIERDAFMCHWYTRTPPRSLDKAALATQLAPPVQALLHRRGIDLHLFDMTTELGVPCILSMAPRREGRGVAIGASCRATVASAAEKALIEIYHNLRWILDTERSGIGPAEAEEIRNFEDHARYYFLPERRKNLEFLFTGKEGPLPAPLPCPPGDARAELRAMVERLRAFGYHVILVDMTPDDVRQLGFVVVRAIVPGLHPLSCGAERQHLDDRRLRAFAAARGAPPPSRINRDIHPFP